MAISDVLDSLWGTHETMSAVFEFRAKFENALNVIIETIDRTDEIVAENDFSNLDSELLTKGQACRQALNDAKLILNDHSDFCNWRKPE